MLSIVRLVGQPANRVLKNGRRTKSFFDIIDDKVWAIKVPQWTFSDLYRPLFNLLSVYLTFSWHPMLRFCNIQQLNINTSTLIRLSDWYWSQKVPRVQISGWSERSKCEVAFTVTTIDCLHDHEDDLTDAEFGWCFLNQMRLEKNNKTEAVEREQCVELLKAMLKVNADERITPREVLAHPFITKNYPR